MDGRRRDEISPRRARAISLLALVTLALVVEAWLPFRPEIPLHARATPEWLGPDVVRFDGTSMLASDGPMAWVEAARRTEGLDVALELRSQQVGQRGPARVLAVSADHHNADLVVGQDGDDLVVRLRRPGSDASGDAAFRVRGLLADLAWHRVDLRVAGDRLVVVADGALAVDEPVGADALAGWDPGYRVALGDDVAAERGWRGDVRLAEVIAGGETVDLLAHGQLEPATGLVVEERLAHVARLSNGDPWFLVLLRLVVFVPVGWLVQALWRSWRRTAAVAVGLPVALLLGKVLVDGRHPRLGDVAISAVGVLLGAALAESLRRRRLRREVGPSPSGQPDVELARTS
jgi:hypothetical protein